MTLVMLWQKLGETVISDNLEGNQCVYYFLLSGKVVGKAANVRLLTRVDQLP